MKNRIVFAGKIVDIKYRHSYTYLTKLPPIYVGNLSSLGALWAAFTLPVGQAQLVIPPCVQKNPQQKSW